MTEENTEQKPNPLARKTPATRKGDPSLYASVNDIAAQAIKSVFIANGGGVLVLLAFCLQHPACHGSTVVDAAVRRLSAAVAGHSAADG